MGDDIRWFRKQLEEFADKGGQVSVCRRFLDIWSKRGMSVWSRGCDRGRQKAKPLILIARDRLISVKDKTQQSLWDQKKEAFSIDSVHEIYDLLKAQAFKDFKRDLFRYVEKGRLDTVQQILDFKDNVFISQEIEGKEKSLLDFAREKAREEHGRHSDVYVFLKKRALDSKERVLFQSIRNGDMETILQILHFDKQMPFYLEGDKTIVDVVHETSHPDTFKKEVEKLYDIAVCCEKFQYLNQVQSNFIVSYFNKKSWTERTALYVRKKTNIPPVRLIRRAWNKQEPVFGRVKKILGYVTAMHKVQQR